METLLLVAIVLIALAIIAQAGALIAMYVMSRRLAEKAEALMNDSRRLTAPLESITNNLKSVTEDLAQSGKMARQQVQHIQEFVAESQQSIRGQVTDVRNVVMDTVEEARSVVMRPIRQYAALSTGIAEGIRTFFSSRKRSTETYTASDEKHPAA